MGSKLESDPIYQSVSAKDALFCSLIKLIPKEVYYHTATADGIAEANDEEETTSRYYKHKKAPLAADEKKKQRKQRRDATYGLNGEPENDDEEAAEEAGAGAELSAASAFDLDLDDVEGIADLRKRLQDKIQAMQSGRNLPKGEKKVGAREDKPKKVESESESEDEDEEGSAEGSVEADSDSDMSVGEEYMYSDMDASDSDSGEANEALVDDVGDIDFSGIITSRRDATGDQTVRNKPGSKMKRLKKLVEESKQKRQRLDDLKASGASGKDRAAAEAWNDVLKEAAGEKVLSNTKRLQKAIKIREKKKEKSASAWQNRVENVAADKTARIQKREANIKQRKLGIAPAAPAEDGTGTGEAAKTTRKDRAALAKKISSKKEAKEKSAKGGGSGDNKKSNPKKK